MHLDLISGTLGVASWQHMLDLLPPVLQLDRDHCCQSFSPMLRVELLMLLIESEFCWTRLVGSDSPGREPVHSYSYVCVFGVSAANASRQASVCTDLHVR